MAASLWGLQPRWRRLAACAGVGALLAGCGSSAAAHHPTTTAVGSGATTSSSTSASGTTSSTTPPSTTLPSTTPLTTVPTTTSPGGSVPPVPLMLTSTSTVPPVGPAPVSLPVASIPWGQVSPGWTLALYNSSQWVDGTGGPLRRAGVEALFLVGPNGGRYVVDHWASSLDVNDQLVAWSASERQALVVRQANGPGTRVVEISITTGDVVGSFPVPSPLEVTGYAPDGTDLLARDVPVATADSATAPGIVEVLTPTGSLRRTVLRTSGLGAVLPGPAGSVVVGDHAGVQLVGPSGQVTNLDPSSETCSPLHLLSTSELLANCAPRSSSWSGRMWELSTGGMSADSKPLTPPTSKVVGGTGTPWAGITAQDLDAWQLPSGLYLQVAGACATVFIGRQMAGPYVRYVGIPGVAPGASMGIVGAVGNELEVDVITNGCNPPPTLVWFDPSTNHVQRVLVAAPDSTGFSELPYPTLESSRSIG